MLAWLDGPEGFLERVGLPSMEQSVKFVKRINGREGKGVVARDLGLSFFVDDTGEVLESVFADIEGNSGDVIKQFDGVLFHFSSHGKWKGRSQILQCRSHYQEVSSWSKILEVLSTRLVKDTYVDSWNLEEVLSRAPWKKPLSSLEFSALCK
jgi:hypothetical protein